MKIVEKRQTFTISIEKRPVIFSVFGDDLTRHVGYSMPAGKMMVYLDKL